MATVSVTPIRVFVSGETVTPTKLNELSQPTVAVSAITNADIDASAAIASTKLSTATQQSLVPAGAVMPFAMNSAPSGWLAADGTAVSRSTYATLFTAIGTTHGSGDGSTTFNLPDLRGYFVRGSGTNGDGTAAGAFGAKQADALKSHTHVVGSRVNAAAFGTGIIAASNSATINGANNSTEATGDTETRPKNIALLYCIKF